MSSGPIEIYLHGTWSIPPDALRRSEHAAVEPRTTGNAGWRGRAWWCIGQFFSISPHRPRRHRLIAVIIRRIITTKAIVNLSGEPPSPDQPCSPPFYLSAQARTCVVTLKKSTDMRAPQWPFSD